MNYRIVSWADLYNGNWCVIRLEDMRLVKTIPDLWTAIRWERTWGPVSGGIHGQKLSWRALERLEQWPAAGDTPVTR